MKILQIHNQYQNPGGEDVVVEAEHQLMTERGHDVRQWLVSNETLRQTGRAGMINVAINSIWSRHSQKTVARIIADYRPDVAHIHNTIPLISPSVYRTCQEMNVAVVQTLHNYRTICPSSPLYRDAHVCTDCLGKAIPYPAVAHGCYRGSRLQSLLPVASLSYNRMRGTYRNDVDRYISLTEFARDQLVAGGLPADKIIVKPNFIAADIEQGSHDGGYAFFAGRLVPHKGVATLIDAWRQLDQPIPLKIAGKGPLERLRQGAPDTVEWLGQIAREEVFRLMRHASVVVFPSEWYEPFGLAVIEAFATAAPVIASKIGGLAEIVEDGGSGWHFRPGAAKDLAQKVQQAWANPAELKRRGQVARQQFEEKYVAEPNYRMLLSIYDTAVESMRAKRARGA